MKNNARRKFVKQSLYAATTASILPSFLISCNSSSDSKEKEMASPEPSTSSMNYFDHIGFQLYTARDAFGADGEETLKKIADIGYKEVEFHNAGLIHDYIPVLSDLGMKVTSTHFPPPYLTGQWDAYGMTEPKDMEFSNLLGICGTYGVKYIVMPMLLPQERGDIEYYKRLANTFNEYGKICKQASVQFCYHNHNFEFEPMGDTSPMDILLAETDPELVVFELDIFWVTASGNDPVAFMKKHADRIKLLHLKDLKEGLPANFKTLETSQQHPDFFVEVGKGVVDFKSVLTTAAEIGVTNCYVEQDHSPDPLASLATSYQYLSKLGL